MSFCYLRWKQPSLDEGTTQDAGEHGSLTEFVFEVYDHTKNSLVATVVDSCAIKKSIANKLKIFFFCCNVQVTGSSSRYESCSQTKVML